MRFELKIAWRYLFAKKTHNAINIVSGVSAAGICIATAALVCVLSVMNGFNRVIEGMFSNFDPELLLSPASGKSFAFDTDKLLAVKEMPEVAIFSPTIEEAAMIEYKERQTAAVIKGVDDQFQNLSQIDSIIFDGEFLVFDGAFDRCVLGWELAEQIGVNPYFVGAVKIFAPKRKEKVNLMRPDRSINKEAVYMAGTFAVNQSQYDARYAIVSIDCARRLFDYADNEATAVELRLTDGANLKQTKAKIRQMLGDDFVVSDRYEQQADFFRISKIEKWLSMLLLAFILMIASFNVIGSLSMLMLEKKEDIRILNNIGASCLQIRRIFLFEGWLISAIGALLGLLIGLAFCLLQECFGIIKLGSGVEYALSAYPVDVQGTDILLVAMIVLLMGFMAAWYPTRNVKTDIAQE